MQNILGLQESALLTMGGVVSEVNAYDVPAGSAAVATDCDFTVASVKTRDGVQNVYAYSNEEITKQAGMGASLGAGQAWVSPNNITLNNPATPATVGLNVPGISPAFSGTSSIASNTANGTVNATITAVPNALINVGDLMVILGGCSNNQTNTLPIVSAPTDGSGNTWASPGAGSSQTFENNVAQGQSLNVFTAAASATTATYAAALTNVQVLTNVLTIVAPNSFSPGDVITFSHVVSASFLNGQTVTISTASSTGFTASYTSSNYGPLPDTGICGKHWTLSQSATVSPDTANITLLSYWGLASIGTYSTVTVGSAKSPPQHATFTGGSYSYSGYQVILSFAYSDFTKTVTTGTTWIGASGGGSIEGDYTVISGTSGTFNDTWTQSFSGTWATFFIVYNYSGNNSGNTSQELSGTVYGFNITGSQVLGIQVGITGSQILGSTVLTLRDNLTSTLLETFALGSSSGTLNFGGVSNFLGLTLTPSIVDKNAFGFEVQAQDLSGNPASVSISSIAITVWITPPGVAQFDYIKSFEMTDGDTLNIALDNTGVFWQEDILSAPGILTPFYTGIEPNTFARSTTIDNREFIALSDLSNGTDMPRQYNGQWVDRISQVGPAAPPSISSTSTTYSVVSITQPAAVNIGGPSQGGVQWTSGVNSHTPGNTLIPYDAAAGFLGTTPNMVQVGSVVFLQLTGPGLSGGDGTYIVTSTGSALGMESGDGTSFNYFTVTAPSTAQLNVFNNSSPVGTYQLTIATLTVSAPVPGLTVGSQVTLAGVSPGTWDGTWTISNVVNGGSFEVTSTQLTSDVATYNFSITSGVGPSVGSFVTITGCTNGPVVNGQSIFNQFQAIVNSVGPGYFTIFPINAANVPLAPETTAVGLVLGTVFQFDPGLNDVGTATNPILGNGSGGSLVIAGGLGSGLRQAVVMFETRNGFITQPSPPFTFNLSTNANQITATNLPIGPPNVIRRIVAFTGANGGFFFYIPQPVTVVSSGQTVTYTSTVVNDNTSSQATFNFTDTILLSSISIDSQGNNLFAQEELGSSIGVVAYSQRLFAWGEQSKIENLLNYSFDGGYLAITQTTPAQPLGWTIDPTNGTGGSLTTSPLFGNAYLISNTSGSTQALYGMIEQSAYQDYLKTPIINVQTQYSVRVTASCPVATASGNLVIDLYSPSFMAQYGAFTLPLSTLSTTMSIHIGTLLTTAFQTSVPSDLLIRVYAQNIPNNGQVLIDRFEPFDTSLPTLTTQLRGSYFSNFEAFDTITGNLGVGAENQQPVRNAFELFDTLYIVKSKSFLSSSDNGTTEPSGWTVREVSNKVGTPSIYLVDVGEGWALIGSEAGLYLFSGGEPIKINPELDGNPGIWQSLDWSQGQKFWLRNDTEKRKIYIGACMPTPNIWAPRFPVNASPTQPNVVLTCNYKELMTSGALANEGPVRLTYTGELKSYSLGRKWSIWSIQACYADFIDRPNNSAPIFFCSDQGPEIFQQVVGLYSDNGNAMHWNYIAYPFPKSQEAEMKQFGLSMMEAHQMNLLVQGNGQLRMTIIPDDLRSQDAIALYPEPLANPTAYGDVEIPILQTGNRFFPEFYVTDVGEWAELSRVVMWISPYAWAPVRGSNS